MNYNLSRLNNNMNIKNIIKKHYSEITQEEWELLEMEEIVNWCWPKWWCIKPPYSIFFKSSCDIHDLSYYIWWNKCDRKKADLWFLKVMIEDCNKNTCFFKKNYYKVWCYVYYIAVRVFGWKYFNYK